MANISNNRVKKNNKLLSCYYGQVLGFVFQAAKIPKTLQINKQTLKKRCSILDIFLWHSLYKFGFIQTIGTKK